MRALRVCFAFAGIWCALVESAEAVAGRLFQMELDGDWFLLLAAGDSQEIRRFFLAYAGALSLAGAVFAVCAVACVVLAWRARRRVFLTAVAVLAVFAGCRLCRYGRGWKPLYVLYDTLRSAGEYRELREAGAWTDAQVAQVRPAAAGATNLVLVIGESLTPDRMSIYGYSKRTTPGLASLTNRLAVLGPIATTHPDTARALRMILTRATKARPARAQETLPVFLRRHGYRTALVSAQRHWERYCGVEQAIFAACESKTYLQERIVGRTAYDEDLIPFVCREMRKSDTRPFALFVHMKGSHFAPGDQVPPHFAASEGLDDYDRSVRYTDEVLSQLIRALPPRTLFVFVSDHGESTDADGWRQTDSPALWRVPLLVFPRAAALPFRAVTDIGEIWYNSRLNLWE